MKLLIKNGKIVDVIKSNIYVSDIIVEGGIIKKISSNLNEEKLKTMDAKNYFLIPGLIDAHTHNEMSMLSPINFAKAILSRGTTSVILDFHDLANVMGIQDAFEFNLNEFNKTLLNVFYMLPVCVPSSTKTENCGNKDSLEDIKPLLDKKEIIGVAEVMNFNAVLNGNQDLINFLNLANSKNLFIDGHCPGLTQEKLKKYILLSRASTDHEFFSYSEAMEKLNLGLKLILRRGITNEPNAYEIWNNSKNKSNILLSTDGCVTPEHIIKNGHMDFALKQIIKEGIPVLEAIKLATINISKHYKLDKIGAIKEGNFADIIFVSDLENFKIEKVISKGKLVDNQLNFSESHHPTKILNSIKRDYLFEKDFQLNTKKTQTSFKMRIIKLVENSLRTEEEIHTLLSNKRGLFINSNLSEDITHISVINRYNSQDKIINGFVKGFGLKLGAIACSNAQDAQNIIAIGTNHKDMEIATNEVIKMQGGCVLVENFEIIKKIKLPLAGIMSINPLEELTKEVKDFEENLRKLGCNISNPLFYISLMFTVSSIPKLKITNKGIYDVEEDKFKGVFIDE